MNYYENYKKFEAEEPHTLLEQDLDVSSNTDEKDKKEENEDGSCFGKNRIFPANDPRSEVSGEDPEVKAQSNPKHANPEEEASSQEKSDSDTEKPRPTKEG